MTAARAPRFVEMLEQAGLLYQTSAIPAKMSGADFYRDHFAKCLPAWLERGVLAPVLGAHDERQGLARASSPAGCSSSTTTRATRTATCRCRARTRRASRSSRCARSTTRRSGTTSPTSAKSLKALGFTEEDVRDVAAAADDARALELHAPGRARGRRSRTRSARRCSRARRPIAAPTTRTTRSAAELYGIPQGRGDAHLRAPRSRRAVPALRPVPRDPAARSTTMSAAARVAGPRLRPPARRAHLDVDREHRALLRGRARTPMPRRAFDPIWTDRSPPHRTDESRNSMRSRPMPLLRRTREGLRPRRRHRDRVPRRTRSSLDGGGARCSARFARTSTARRGSIASPRGSRSRAARVHALGDRLRRRGLRRVLRGRAAAR